MAIVETRVTNIPALSPVAHAMRRDVSRHVLILGLALSAGAGVAAPTAAQSTDNALCAPLTEILTAAPREFRALRGDDYSTKFESWRAKITLDGYDACWIDDVSRSFWCLLQAPDMPSAASRAERTIADVTACHPTARQQQGSEAMDNNVTRVITEWIVESERRLRLVHRYPTKPPGLAAVFLYVY